MFRPDDDRAGEGDSAALGPLASHRLPLILERLDRLERLVTSKKEVKDYYSPAEAAELIGKAEFTVREWCRLGRIRAKKRAVGRGDSKGWMIAREELVRFQNEGLLPDPATAAP